MALVSSDILPGPLPPSPPSFHANALTSLLRSSNKLSDFIWTEHERPLVAHDQFEFDEELPVIDLAALETGSDAERQARLASLVLACQEWGFFQVVNHGVSSDLIREMDLQAGSFFKLQLQQKLAVLRDSSSRKPMGYMYGGVGTRLKRDIPWMESLQMPAVQKDIEAYSNRIWQSGNSQFWKVATDFSQSLKTVALRLLRLVIEQLGLGSNSLHDSLGEGENSVLRLHSYPPCPQPSLTLGLGAHSDPHLLTILHQDDVGGLQIFKDGKWIAVRPKLNSFIVNVGDALQVWSNDIYKSVEHRVVCNSKQSRRSMAFFLNPADESTIAPAPELTDTEHPSKYRAFTWQEYRECIYTHRPRGKSNLLMFKHQDDHDQTNQTTHQ